MSNLIHLNEKDNVAMASVILEKGVKIDTHDLVCNTVIPAGHKVAIHDIPKGGPVYKYGDIIGYALEHIKKGNHVHSHNLYVKKASCEHICESQHDHFPLKKSQKDPFSKDISDQEENRNTELYRDIVNG